MGSARSARPAGGRRNRRTTAIRTQSKAAIRVAAAALALSASGIAVSISGGMSAAHASVVSARHAPGNTGFADLSALAQAKRDALGNAVQRAPGR
jgi:hypothetical protein